MATTSISSRIVGLMLLGLLTGCGQTPTVKSHPVKGTVSVNGKPAGGVYLQFHSLENKELAKRPDGCKTEKDGTYQVNVHGTGEFALTSFWPTVKIELGEEIEGQDRFNGEFRSIDSPVRKIRIQDGENVIPPLDIRPKQLVR